MRLAGTPEPDAPPSNAAASKPPAETTAARPAKKRAASRSKRETATERPSEAAEHARQKDDVTDFKSTTQRTTRVGFLDWTERLRGLLRRQQKAARMGGDRPKNPVLVLVLAFVLWGVLRIVGYAPLMLLLRFVAFLLTPLGLVVWLFLAYVYSVRHAEFHRRVATLRERARMFGRVVSQALGSIGWLRGRLDAMRPSAAPAGRPVEGVRVRILEEEDETDKA